MKVRLTLDVDAQARYIIARYYRGTDDQKARGRATRRQVKRFAEAALRRVVRDVAETLDARGRGAVRRLQRPSQLLAETVPPPKEQQLAMPLPPADR